MKKFFKKVATSIVSIYTDAKATSEQKVKQELVNKENKLAVKCPHCKERFVYGEISKLLLKKEYIEINKTCLVNFLKCDKCGEIMLFHRYAEGVYGDIVHNTYKISDKKENDNV